jgi:hypothetical protein
MPPTCVDLNVGNNNGVSSIPGRTQVQIIKLSSQHKFGFTNYQINAKTDPTDQRMHALELNVLQLNAGIKDIKTIYSSKIKAVVHRLMEL